MWYFQETRKKENERSKICVADCLILVYGYYGLSGGAGLQELSISIFLALWE